MILVRYWNLATNRCLVTIPGQTRDANMAWGDISLMNSPVSLFSVSNGDNGWPQIIQPFQSNQCVSVIQNPEQWQEQHGPNVTNWVGADNCALYSPYPNRQWHILFAYDNLQLTNVNNSPQGLGISEGFGYERPERDVQGSNLNIRRANAILGGVSSAELVVSDREFGPGIPASPVVMMIVNQWETTSASSDSSVFIANGPWMLTYRNDRVSFELFVGDKGQRWQIRLQTMEMLNNPKLSKRGWAQLESVARPGYFLHYTAPHLTLRRFNNFDHYWSTLWSIPRLMRPSNTADTQVLYPRPHSFSMEPVQMEQPNAIAIYQWVLSTMRPAFQPDQMNLSVQMARPGTIFTVTTNAFDENVNISFFFTAPNRPSMVVKGAPSSPFDQQTAFVTGPRVNNRTTWSYLTRQDRNNTPILPLVVPRTLSPGLYTLLLSPSTLPSKSMPFMVLS